MTLVCVQTNWGFGGAVVTALAFHLWVCGFDSERELSQCYSNPVLHSLKWFVYKAADSDSRFIPLISLFSPWNSNQRSLSLVNLDNLSSSKSIHKINSVSFWSMLNTLINGLGNAIQHYAVGYAGVEYLNWTKDLK